MTTLSLPRPARRATAQFGLRTVAKLVVTWSARRKMRSDLLKLDESQLADIGLANHEMRNEADKPFWRA
ncbi:DUF1127 domain-containing protein [Albirhodobacter sp. R86504]|jgi:uncharacterized protein YjiS (DUF1127 family)|uniref:DUF1127 domain-containing protein n=1 Tax=Albirhodobacter sp. R86504 TaxID=3093848 RepID=UPI0036722781